MSTLVGPVPELDETGVVAGEAVLPWLRELEGFRGMMILTDETQEKARVVTFWGDRSAFVQRLGSAVAFEPKMPYVLRFRTLNATAARISSLNAPSSNAPSSS